MSEGRESWEKQPEEAKSDVLPHLEKNSPKPVPLKKKLPKFDTYTAKLVRMETKWRDLWEFVFELEKPMEFIAGQYASIIVPGHKKPAPFSIASSPIHKNQLDFGIEVIGEVTTAMSLLKPGDQVTMKGPFGEFIMGPHERKVCFLAGGIGVTPFMSMLRWIRDTHPDKHAVLFYSCKAEDQFMWLEELREMQESCENIKIILTCTKEEKEGFSSGRIDETMIREELPDFDEYVYFTCGPQGLIEAMIALMTSMGISKENVRREAWH